MLYKASLLTVAALAMAGPDKPEMDPAMDRPRLTQGLMDNLPPVRSDAYYWGGDWMPQSCLELAKGHNLNPWDFTMYNIQYDDCSEPWVFCRHKDARASLDDMIDRFSRIPVSMRSYIRHFIGTPNLNDGAVAFTFSNGDMVFEDYPGLDSVVHEISHSLDWHALSNYNSPFSDTNEWQSEYAKDSHTPTWYGRYSWAEDFAEAGMAAVYDKVVPGGFGGMAGNWQQYDAYKNYLGDTIAPGGVCKIRFDNSPIVHRGDSKKAAMKSTPKPDVSVKAENITLIVPKKEVEGLVAYNWLK